jgi:hypothetical protein
MASSMPRNNNFTHLFNINNIYEDSERYFISGGSPLCVFCLMLHSVIFASIKSFHTDFNTSSLNSSSSSCGDVHQLVCSMIGMPKYFEIERFIGIPESFAVGLLTQQSYHRLNRSIFLWYTKRQFPFLLILSIDFSGVFFARHFISSPHLLR